MGGGKIILDGDLEAPKKGGQEIQGTEASTQATIKATRDEIAEKLLRGAGYAGRGATNVV